MATTKPPAGSSLQAREEARIAREVAAARANELHREQQRQERARRAAERGGHTRARYGARLHLPALDGCGFVTTDAHYWPGQKSLAHRAAVFLAKRMKPWFICNNGDSFDGASVSRFAPSSLIGLGRRPTVIEELVANTQHLQDFEDLDFVHWLFWNMGNHDARYESFLATRVPEYAGVDGFHLKDKFPGWLPAWSTWIGGDLVIKHRFKGGKYAAANDTLFAGRSTITGHDHTLWVKAYTDYNGTRWGAKAGTLQNVWGEAFLDYTEDHPVDWQSGFLIAQFRGGRLTGFELVNCLDDGRVLFRGDVIQVPS